jgi:hypothetical protein
MPRKIRELVHDLQDAGFIDRGGEEGHRNFVHSIGVRVTLSGDPDGDAVPYQEWQVLNVRCGSRVGCIAMMKNSDRYVKIVEWSEEDECYVGQCPGIIGPCCHGVDQVAVYAELCRIVDEWVDIMRNRGEPLPPPTAGQGVAQKILDGVKGVGVETRPPT